jgi:non-homologous end joining protein Ku
LIEVHTRTGHTLTSVNQTLGGNSEVLVETRTGPQQNEQQKAANEMGKKRLRSFFQFAQIDVPMSADDKVKIKAASNATDYKSLVLVGFKDKDDIPFTETMEAAYFVYPNDDVVQGSGEAFAYLHASMLRKGVLAIAELLVSSSATSRLYALWPIEEAEEEDEAQTPPGLVAVALPFLDDFHKLPDEGEAQVPESVQQAALDIVQKLTFGAVIGQDFENVNLERVFQLVEAVAMNESKNDIRSVYDAATDEEEAMLRDEIAVMKDHIKVTEKIAEGETAAKNNKPKAGARPKPKKILPLDESGIDWEELYMNDDIGSCKVKDLNQYLKSVGEPTSGNKGPKVTRVKNHIEAVLTERAQDKVKTEVKTESDECSL